MSDDKHLPASAKKRESESKKGNIPQSQELLSAVVLFSALLGATMAAPLGVAQLLSASKSTWALEGGKQIDVEPWLSSYLLILVPALTLSSAAVVGINFVARKGLRFVPLKFDWARMSPLKNAKQKWFSPEAIGALVLSLLKFFIVGAVAAFPFFVLLKSDNIPAVSSVDAAAKQIWKFGFALVLPGALAFLLTGALDYAYQVFRHERNIRMSFQDLKDEHKEEAGDPQLVQARKRRHREIAQRQDILAVQHAAALVVNPEHYAVAIAYDVGVHLAPIVIAKGNDQTALRMRREARDHKVPVVRKAPVARALYRNTRRGHPIPQNMYRAVAIILARIQSPGDEV